MSCSSFLFALSARKCFTRSCLEVQECFRFNLFFLIVSSFDHIAMRHEKKIQVRSNEVKLQNWSHEKVHNQLMKTTDYWFETSIIGVSTAIDSGVIAVSPAIDSGASTWGKGQCPIPLIKEPIIKHQCSAHYPPFLPPNGDPASTCVCATKTCPHV